MSTIAGKAKVVIGADIKQLQGALKRAAKNIQTFATSVRDAGMAIGGAGLAMAAPMIGAIKIASDMQEAVSKFDVVFGKNANVVRAWADEYAASVGRSELQTVKFLASLQDLFIPLGFASDKATDLSKQVTMLATDLASFNNTTDDAALRDLQAAITGSGEVMKKYGVVLTEAAVKQELFNMSIDPKTASNQEKVLARLNIIMRGTTAAQGDALKTAGSFANRMKALRASFENLAVTVGNMFLPYATRFVDFLVKAAKNVKNFAKENKPLILLFGKISVALIAVGGSMVALGVSVLAMMKIWALLTGVIIAAKAVFLSLGGLFAAMLSPMGLVIAAAAALGYIFKDEIIEAFKNIIKSGQPLLSFFGELKAVFKDIVNALAAGDTQAAFDIFKSSAMIAMKTVEANWVAFTTTISSIWNEVINLIIDGWDWVQKKIVLGINGMIQALKSIADMVPGLDLKLPEDLSPAIENEFAERKKEREKDLQDAANASAKRIEMIKQEIEENKKAMAAARQKIKKEVADKKKAQKEIFESEKDYTEITHGASVGGFSQRGIAAQTGVQKKLIDVNERTAKATEKIAVLMERSGSFTFI